MCESGLSFNVSHAVHPEATSSLMFTTDPDHITKFCDQASHDRFAPTKHNSLCGRRSVMEVINSHKDFDDRYVNIIWYSVMIKLSE